MQIVEIFRVGVYRLLIILFGICKVEFGDVTLRFQAVAVGGLRFGVLQVGLNFGVIEDGNRFIQFIFLKEPQRFGVHFVGFVGGIIFCVSLRPFRALRLQAFVLFLQFRNPRIFRVQQLFLRLNKFIFVVQAFFGVPQFVVVILLDFFAFFLAVIFDDLAKQFFIICCRTGKERFRRTHDNLHDMIIRISRQFLF